MTNALVEHVYLKDSMVELECSDRGEFCNEIRDNLHRLLQIQGVRSVGLRPLNNSLVERLHKSLHGMMSKMVDSDQRN